MSSYNERDHPGRRAEDHGHPIAPSRAGGKRATDPSKDTPHERVEIHIHAGAVTIAEGAVRDHGCLIICGHAHTARSGADDARSTPD